MENNQQEQLFACQAALARSSRLNRSFVHLGSLAVRGERHKWQSIGAIDKEQQQQQQASNFERLRKGYASMRKSFRLQIARRKVANPGQSSIGLVAKSGETEPNYNGSQPGSATPADESAEPAQQQAQFGKLVCQLGNGAARLLRAGSTKHQSAAARQQVADRWLVHLQSELDGSELAPQRSQLDRALEARLGRRGRRHQLADAQYPQPTAAELDIDLAQVEAIKRDNLRLNLGSGGEPSAATNFRSLTPPPALPPPPPRLQFEPLCYCKSAQERGQTRRQTAATFCSCSSVSSLERSPKKQQQQQQHFDHTLGEQQAQGVRLQHWPRAPSGQPQQVLGACQPGGEQEEGGGDSGGNLCAIGANECELEKLCGELSALGRRGVASVLLMDDCKQVARSDFRQNSSTTTKLAELDSTSSKSEGLKQQQQRRRMQNKSSQECGSLLGGVASCGRSFAHSQQRRRAQHSAGHGRETDKDEEPACEQAKSNKNHQVQGEREQLTGGDDEQQDSPTGQPDSSSACKRKRAQKFSSVGLEPEEQSKLSDLDLVENNEYHYCHLDYEQRTCSEPGDLLASVAKDDLSARNFAAASQREQEEEAEEEEEEEGDLDQDETMQRRYQCFAPPDEPENLYACIYEDLRLHPSQAAAERQVFEAQQQLENWTRRQQQLLACEANERRQLFERQLQMKAQLVHGPAKPVAERSGGGGGGGKAKSLLGRLKQLVSSGSSGLQEQKKRRWQHKIGLTQNANDLIIANHHHLQEQSPQLAFDDNNKQQQQQQQPEEAEEEEEEEYFFEAQKRFDELARGRLSGARSTQTLLNTSMRELAASRKSVNLPSDQASEREKVGDARKKRRLFSGSSSSAAFMSGFLTLGRRAGAAAISSTTPTARRKSLAATSAQRPKRQQARLEFVGHLFGEQRKGAGSLDSLPSADSGLGCGLNTAKQHLNEGSATGSQASASDSDQNFGAPTKRGRGPTRERCSRPPTAQQNIYTDPHRADQLREAGRQARFVGKARAKVDCNPCAYDRAALVFKRGDLINIIERNHSGTWLGQCGQQVGHFKFINVIELASESESEREEEEEEEEEEDEEEGEKGRVLPTPQLSGHFVTKLEIKSSPSPIEQPQQQRRSVSMSEIIAQPDNETSRLGASQDKSLMNSLEQLLFAIGLADEGVARAATPKQEQQVAAGQLAAVARKSQDSPPSRPNSASPSAAAAAAAASSYLQVLQLGGIKDLDSFSALETSAELQRIGIINDEHQRRLLVAARIIRQALSAAKRDLYLASGAGAGRGPVESNGLYQANKSMATSESRLQSEPLEGVPQVSRQVQAKQVQVEVEATTIQSDERPSGRLPLPPARRPPVVGQQRGAKKWPKVDCWLDHRPANGELNNNYDGATIEPLYVNLPSSMAVQAERGESAPNKSGSKPTPGRTATLARCPATATGGRASVSDRPSINATTTTTTTTTATTFTRGCSLRVSKRQGRNGRAKGKHGSLASGDGGQQQQQQTTLAADLRWRNQKALQQQQVRPATLSRLRAQSPSAATNNSANNDHSKDDHYRRHNLVALIGKGEGCNKELRLGGRKLPPAGGSNIGQTVALPSVAGRPGRALESDHYGNGWAANELEENDYSYENEDRDERSNDCDSNRPAGRRTRRFSNHCTSSQATSQDYQNLDSKLRIINSKSAYDLRLNLSHFFS